MHGTAVVGDHFFEGREASVVHVGGGEGEVSQTWGGELGGVLEAIIVEAVIGEIGSAVAVEAVGSVLLGAGFIFGKEEFHAALLAGGELFFASGGAVEFGIVAGEREEKVFESEGDLFRGDLAGAEGFFEGGALCFFELLNDGSEIGGHFTMIFDGLEDLLAEGFGAAIPEEGGFPGEIEEGHGIAVPCPAFDSFRKRKAISESTSGIMAGGAGDHAILGEDGIVKEAFTKSDSFLGEGVIAREIRNGEVAAQLKSIRGEFLREMKRGDFWSREFGGLI